MQQQFVGTKLVVQYATSVGSVGSSLLAAPESHTHAYAMASGGMIQPVSTSTSTAGVQTYFTRGDHVHFFDFAGKYANFASNVSLSTSTGGVSSSVSRGDHVHYLAPGTTAEVKTAGSVNDGGVSSKVARIDHVHAFTQITGLVNYAATANIQAVDAVADAGVLTAVARGDHVHNIAFAATATILAAAGVADAGTHTTVARGDHVHNLPFAATATLCNVAWSAGEAGTATDVARGDHVHRILPGTRGMMSGSRTTSTIYTNNGSGPMYIGISMSLSAPGANGAHLQIGGTDVAHCDGGIGVDFFLMGIANPGEEYLLTATGGVNIDHWMEYAF